ncbi:MAG: DUF502 domain-containing protein [Ectobacillus sp.]
MKHWLKHFLNGILTIVPILLIVYVLFTVFTFLDGLLGNAIKSYVGEAYVPGIGILVTIVFLTFLGWLSKHYMINGILRIIDRLFRKVPLVKTLYTSIQDILQSLLGEKRSFSKVVLVTIPGTSMKSLGFVTSEELHTLYEPLQEYVAVFIPQTFQVAGITFLVPKSDIEVLDIKPEDAMKFILSAGMTNQSE